MEQYLNAIIQAARKRQEEHGPTKIPTPSISSAEERAVFKIINGIPPKYKDCSFENFEGNDAFVQHLRSYAEQAESVFLTGKTGCGKTHLGISMLRTADINKISRIWPARRGEEWETPPQKYFTTLPEVLLRIRESFQEKSKHTESEVISYYADIDCLCLDDLGAEKPSAFSISALYLILDRRIRNERQTIITSNMELTEIEKVCGARIASRISEMKIIKINMPDYRKKRG